MTMEMESRFRTRIDEYWDKFDKETNQSSKENAKFINFIWLDGSQHGFNYSYLSNVRFEPGESKNIIEVSFTSHRIKIEGYRLKTVYQDLISLQLKTLVQQDNRYTELDNNQSEPFVTDIILDEL